MRAAVEAECRKIDVTWCLSFCRRREAAIDATAAKAFLDGLRRELGRAAVAGVPP
ncbi:MAG: hypothetical protein IT577_08600 [Verrucomicrobiae bacterium]|nr:hypothetical protein [Verrucomicrobiae bacterium]